MFCSVQVLPCKEVLYAVGQGALAIECMATNTAVLQMLAPLNHADTFCRVLAERSFLKTLGRSLHISSTPPVHFIPLSVAQSF